MNVISKKNTIEYLSYEELHSIYHSLKKDIKARLKEFESVPRTEYFYELSYCLLTPQSSAVNAGNAINELKRLNFQTRSINPEPVLNNKSYYIRFHKTKAIRLLEMRNKYSEIEELLIKRINPVEKREWLVENVKGLGWKEASHFLRNTGHKNLAILDRHILRNLVRCRALQEIPKTLSTKEYLRIEKQFLDFAEKVSITMDELDLVFWCMATGKILK